MDIVHEGAVLMTVIFMAESRMLNAFILTLQKYNVCFKEKEYAFKTKYLNDT